MVWRTREGDDPPPVVGGDPGGTRDRQVRDALGRWSSRGVQEALELAMVAVEAADLQDLPAPTPARRGRFNLTPREQEVLALVASGMSDGEIASSLVISKKTASVHVANIKAKLGASSRVEVATIALRESLA
jgi:DNA-binding NarL/FixJ family response regulator